MNDKERELLHKAADSIWFMAERHHATPVVMEILKEVSSDLHYKASLAPNRTPARKFGSNK